MVNKSAILLLLVSNLFSQISQDARMMGLNGSYTTLASGFRAVGINPANIIVYPRKSWSISEFSMSFNNNYFSIDNYNALSGSHLNDPEHENYTDYYPKEKLLAEFGGRGLQIRQSLNFPLPALNMSTHRMAFTSRLTTNLEMGLSDGLVQFIFSGNPFGEDRYLDFEEVFLATQEFGFSRGYSFQGYSAGFTVKYLLGLFYMGMESLSSPNVTTDSHGFYGNPKYIIRQAIGGNGLGLDVGMTTDEFNDGYRFGMSVINLLGTIKWTQDNLIRDQLESNFSNKDYYLRPNEMMYINMVIDSITVQNLDSLEYFGDLNLDYSLIYYESYKVIPLPTIDLLTISNDDAEKIVELSDGTYLFPSGGNYKKDVLLGVGGDTTYAVSEENYLEYMSGIDNSFHTRQPLYLRMGISKRWKDQAIVAIDLVTGFSNQFSSSSTWRLSLGAEIIRFQDKYLRMGYAFGGVSGKSISFGYGANIGSIYIDIGLSLNGGFSINSTQGFNLSSGIIWQLN